VSLPNWFVQGALGLVLCAGLLFLYWLSSKLLGEKFDHIYHFIKHEWEDARSRKHTVGSMNMFGFFGLMLFGLICFIFGASQKLLGLVAAAIGQHKAEEMISSTNYLAFAYFLGTYFFLSLVCVAVDNRRR